MLFPEEPTHRAEIRKSTENRIGLSRKSRTSVRCPLASPVKGSDTENRPAACIPCSACRTAGLNTVRANPKKLSSIRSSPDIWKPFWRHVPAVKAACGSSLQFNPRTPYEKFSTASAYPRVLHQFHLPCPNSPSPWNDSDRPRQPMQQVTCACYIPSDA